MRLSVFPFSKKKPNLFEVNLSRSTAYTSAGDVLVDLEPVATGLSADTISISSGELRQGGNLSLLKGNDIFRLVDVEFDGESMSAISLGDGEDIIELVRSSDDLFSKTANVSIDAGDGVDVCRLGSKAILEGTGLRYSSMRLGAGNDLFYGMDDSLIRYTNLDTGLGNDRVWLSHASHSSISLGDDNDSLYLSDQSSLDAILLSTGSGDDLLEILGVVNLTSIDTGSGKDNVIAVRSDEITGTSFSSGSGDDRLEFDILNSTFVQTADGHDTLSFFLGQDNVIGLGTGDDLCTLSGYSLSIRSSSINAGEGYDRLVCTSDLVITQRNISGVPSFLETFSTGGQYVFTYYGEGFDPIFTLTGFEELVFPGIIFNAP